MNSAPARLFKRPTASPRGITTCGQRDFCRARQHWEVSLRATHGLVAEARFRSLRSEVQRQLPCQAVLLLRSVPVHGLCSLRRTNKSGAIGGLVLLNNMNDLSQAWSVIDQVCSRNSKSSPVAATRTAVMAAGGTVTGGTIARVTLRLVMRTSAVVHLRPITRIAAGYMGEQIRPRSDMGIRCRVRFGSHVRPRGRAWFWRHIRLRLGIRIPWIL